MTSATASATGLTPRRLYRFLAVAEAITWTLLITGMVLKYAFDFDALAFPFGFAHGTVFVAYGATQILVGVNQRWRTGLSGAVDCDREASRAGGIRACFPAQCRARKRQAL